MSGTAAAVAIGQMKPLNTIGMALDPSFLSLLSLIRDATSAANQQTYLAALYSGYGT